MACAAALALAQSARPLNRGDGLRGECTAALVAAVGLSADQATALDTLRQQTADSIQAVADQAHALRQQIEMALEAASPDPTAIGSLVIQEFKLRQQIDTIVKNAEAAFVASLSADQQAKYAAFVAAHPGCAALPSHGPGTGLHP
jgi:predicted NBD/HSP70 family sugar kinase